MKYLRIINDKARRLLFTQNELKKKIIFLFNQQIGRSLLFYWKAIEPKLSSRITIKNYCILSGRPRGVYSDFKLSRILLRKMGSKGLLGGLKKKSW